MVESSSSGNYRFMRISWIVYLIAFSCYLPSQINGLRMMPMRMASSAPKSDRNELSKPKREYRTLRGMPCTGTYTTPQGKLHTSAFLGLQKMETEKRLNNGVEEIVIFNVVPVPLRPEIEGGILAAIAGPSSSPSMSSSHWSKGAVTDRDGGFFDSLLTLPYFLHAPDHSNPHAKKKVYDYVHKQVPGVPAFASPYHAMLEALDVVAKLRVTGLLIEVVDRPSKNTISVGGAVLVVPSEMEEAQRAREMMQDEEAPDSSPSSRDWGGDANKAVKPPHSWRLTSKNAKIIKEVQSSKDANFIKCHTDELIGFAFALKLPIVMSAAVFDTLSVAGLLTKSSIDGSLSVAAPHFDTKTEEAQWAAEPVIEAVKPKHVEKMDMAIDDACTFLTMTTAEKREWIRNCGLHPSKFPRPREGSRALDAVMLPMLDIELAYEILRRLAEKDGSYEEAALMTDYESRKPHIARDIAIARAKNDSATANQLCVELDSLSYLPYNPLDPNSGDESWDVELWYYEARKTMYNIAA